MDKDLIKEKFIEAFKLYGTVKHAATVAGVTRQTIYNWKKRDDNFRKIMDEIDDDNVETVESVLLKKCLSGNITAIKYYLSCKRPEIWGNKITVQNGDLSEIDNMDNEQLTKLIIELEQEVKKSEAEAESSSDYG